MAYRYFIICEKLGIIGKTILVHENKHMVSKLGPPTAHIIALKVYEGEMFWDGLHDLGESMECLNLLSDLYYLYI